ncbi:MAG: hypothetical protein CVV07_09360 [Gammaproteobacteria bacterium HGW-Gammaproteobacteria-11]|nr:MAG: hypothetical protein CVV07_09360 [Gammaproteobacteria bacterium HGW-Gammaproteobacteria-11]
MRYILMRKADTQTEAGILPSNELLGAMADYNQRMSQAGVFIGGNGLRPSSEGCRIEFSNGEPKVCYGPFSPTSELLAGYSVLEVDSLEQAIEWAKQWPPQDAADNLCLELRRYYSLEDFEPGAGLDKHHQQQRLPLEMNVHLAFPGTCREAMNFYAEVTGGQLEAMMTYAETPASEAVPAERHSDIIHASLNLRGRRLMGADMPGSDYQRPQGAQVHLEYDCEEQASRVFQSLAEGGEIIMPFEETFWAHRFGMTTDRFGVQWMISCSTQTGCELQGA